MPKKESVTVIGWILFIVAAAVMCAVFLYPLYQNKSRRLKELDEKKQILAEKEAEHDKLSRDVDLLNNSPQAVEKEAREKFKMARPGEKVLFYEQKEEK